MGKGSSTKKMRQRKGQVAKKRRMKAKKEAALK